MHGFRLIVLDPRACIAARLGMSPSAGRALPTTSLMPNRHLWTQPDSRTSGLFPYERASYISFCWILVSGNRLP